MPTWNHQNLPTEIHKAVAAGKFQKDSTSAEKIIFGAASLFLDGSQNYSATPASPHWALPPLPLNKLSSGHPDQEGLRNLVFSALFRAWMYCTDQYPTINNKNYPATPFVIFAEPFLLGLGIGKIEDHLEEFRAFRKKSYIEAGMKIIRGKVE